MERSESLMIRVLIIDDEPRQRRGMEQLLKSIRPDLEIVSLRNGREALDEIRLRPAQIIFSDIRMPHMTGLELAEQVRLILPDTLVILISAYAEFEYAHRAIELNVFSYLLKPIKPDAVRDVLQKALDRLARQQADRVQTTLKEARMRNALSQYHQHLLNLWLAGKLGREQWGEVARQIPGDAGGRLLRLLAADGPAAGAAYTANERSEVGDNLSYWLADALAPVKTVSGTPDGDSRTQTLAVFTNGDLEPALVRYQRQVQTDYGFTLTVMASGYHPRLAAQVAVAREQLDRMMPCLFYSRPGAILLYERCGTLTTELPACPDDVWDRMKQAVLGGRSQEMEQLMGGLLKLYTTPYPQPGPLKDTVIRHLLKLQQSVIDVTARGEQCLFENEVLALRDLTDYAALEEACQALARRLCEQCGNVWLESSPIRKTLRYLDEHYMQDVSLQDMARECHYSASYFSTLFKARTGETFVGYINRLRLEKALQLLASTNLRTADIAAQVGFNDPKYFYRLFNRQYGTSVKAYRKGLRKKEG